MHSDFQTENSNNYADTHISICECRQLENFKYNLYLFHINEYKTSIALCSACAVTLWLQSVWTTRSASPPVLMISNTACTSKSMWRWILLVLNIQSSTQTYKVSFTIFYTRVLFDSSSHSTVTIKLRLNNFYCYDPPTEIYKTPTLTTAIRNSSNNDRGASNDRRYRNRNITVF